MSAALLDVNILFALIYEDHQHHAAVHRWFASNRSKGWATCAHTQISTVRLLTSSFAPNLDFSTDEAAEFVRDLCADKRHQYWEQDVVPTSATAIQWKHTRGYKQFPDVYLLALAVRNNGALATMDRRINLSCVKGAAARHLVVL